MPTMSSGCMTSLDALLGDMGGEPLLGDPELLLPLGDHPAGRHRVDADAVGAELAGEALGQAEDAGLGGRVGRHVGVVDQIGGRGEVDDRAAAGSLHARRHRLRGEEMRAQIDRVVVVPELDGHVLDGMAVVEGGVVDQHGDIAMRRGRFGGRGPQRLDVAQIGLEVERPAAELGFDAIGKFCARAIGDVDEGDLRALPRRSLRSARRRCRSRRR